MGISYDGGLKRIVSKNYNGSAPSLEWVAPPAGSVGTFLGGQVVSIPVYVRSLGGEKPTFDLIAGALPAGLSLNANTGVVSGTVDNFTGTSNWTLRATSGSQSIERSFSADSGFNSAPVWNTPAGNIGLQYDGTVVNTTLSATDPESQPVFYSVVTGTLPSGVNLNTNTGVLSGTLGATADDTTFFFTVRATDTALHADRAFNFTIISNKAPIITSSGDLGRFLENTAVSIQLTASDGNGDPITFSKYSGTLPVGVTLSNSGLIAGQLPLNDNNTDKYDFAVAVSDGLKSAAQDFTLYAAKNIAPVWVTSGTIINGNIGDNVNYQLVATDEFESVTFSNVTAMPSGLFLSNSGLITGELPVVNNTTTYTVTFAATDTSGLSRNRPLGITVQYIDAPVWVSNTNIGFAEEGYSFAYQFQAVTNNQFDTIHYTSDDLPDGFTLDDNGYFHGTSLPVVSDINYNFTVTADNGVYQTPKAFSFTVYNDVAPVWSSNAGVVATQRAYYNIDVTLTATDPNGRNITYSVTGDFPPGITHTDTGGVFHITGTIGEVAEDTPYEFTVTASDGVNQVPRTFSIVALYNALPVWTTPSGSLGSGYETQAFTANVVATDPEGNAVHYALAAMNNLPGGLSLNSNTGSITGFLPTGISNNVTNQFTIDAFDDSQHAVGVPRVFQITTLFDSPPVFQTASPLTPVLIDTPYSATISATGTSTGSITYSIVSGSAPTGLTFYSNGRLMGTPTANATTLFTVEANNGIKTSTKQYSLTVQTNTPPYWISNAGSVGSVTANTGFAFAVSAGDGNGTPLIYAISNSNLPNTVTFANTGVISGVIVPQANTNEVYNFDVSVTDSVNSPVVRSFTLTKLANNEPVLGHASNLGFFYENTAVGVDLSATDSDPNDDLSYYLTNAILPNGFGISATTGGFGGTLGAYANTVDYSFTVNVFDGLATVSKDYTFQARHNNTPVWITNTNLGTARSGYEAAFHFEATDPENQDVIYTLVNGTTVPGDMQFRDGVITTPSLSTLNPRATDEVTYITIRASDGNTYVDKDFYFTILANNPPVWDNVSNVVFNDFEGRTITPFTLLAHDPENLGILYYRATGGSFPSGLIVDANTGVISGTLDSVTEDTPFNFTMGVTDGVFNVTKDFTGTTKFNSPPIWVTASNLGTVKQSNTVNIQLTATANGDTITYAKASGTFPAGVDMNSAGLISGTAPTVTEDTTYNFTITATDTVTGKSTDRAFVFVVAYNRAPVWNTPAGNLYTYLMNSAFSVSISAYDPDSGDSVSFVEVSNTFPNTISFNANTGVISGVLPVVVANTTYSLMVGAFDGSVQTNRTFTFTSVLDTPPVWNTNAGLISTITEGKNLSLFVSASDPQGNGITYTLQANSTLPSGLHLESNGFVHGTTPNVAVNTVVYLNATASDGRFSTDRQFTILVTDNVPPVWSTPSGSLGTFSEGVNMTYTLIATDADGDSLSYSLTNSTTLPSDLHLQSNGRVYGIPVNVPSAGDYNFSVKVTDSTGGNASRDFSVSLLPSSDRTDPYAQQVVFLSQFNDTISLDYFGTTITPGGSAVLDTSVYKYGTASLSLPTSTSYETIANDTSYNLNAANSSTTMEYTIDCWISVSALPSLGNYGQIFSKANANATDYVGARVNSDGAVEFTSYFVGNGGTTVIATSNAVTLGDWHHIAYVIKGANVYTYFDGIRLTTNFITRSAINSPFYIGSASAGFIGNVDDFRMTNVARWTDTAFTPPAVQAPKLPYWSTATGVIKTGEESNPFTYNLAAVDGANTGYLAYVVNSTLTSNTYTILSNGFVSGLYPDAIENSTFTAYVIDGQSNKSRDRSFSVLPTLATASANLAGQLVNSARYNRYTAAMELAPRSGSPVYTSVSFPISTWGGANAGNAVLVSDPSGVYTDNVLKINQKVMYFDTNDNLAPVLGSANWTMEMWNYIPSSTTGVVDIVTVTNNAYVSNQQFFQIRVDMSTGIITVEYKNFYFSGASYTFSSPSSTITANAWKHIALTRNGTDLYLHVNGVMVASSIGTVTSNWGSGTTTFQFNTGNSPSNLQYRRGFNVWAISLNSTASFTPSWKDYVRSVWFSNSNISGYETQNYSYISNVGYFGNTITYTGTNIPANSTLLANGLLYGALPSYGSSLGNVVIYANTPSTSVSINMVYTIADGSPVFNTANTVGFTSDTAVNYSIQATSPLSHSLTYSVVSGAFPSGLTYSANGVLTGSASASSGTATVRATDATLGKSTDFSITVTVSTSYVLQAKSPSGATTFYYPQSNVSMNEAGEWIVTTLQPLSAQFKAWGAAGGGSGGGTGGYATGIYSSIPQNTVFKVWVGGGGVYTTTASGPGGFGGGGSIIAASGGCGSGGGLSGIFNNNTVTQANAILIAGAGGGWQGTVGTGCAGGGTAGTQGTAGGVSSGGLPGTQSAGGAAGVGGNGSNASPGTALAGGNGPAPFSGARGASGGGSGYFGGGGAHGNNASGGGGGGGSGFANAVLLTSTTLTTGAATPANSSDPNYINNAGKPAATNVQGTAGANGLVVIIL